MFRNARGLTQAQLAKGVGVSSRLVRYWEAGQKRPSDARLSEIAAVLACSTADLLNLDGPIPPPRVPTGDDIRRHAQTMPDRD